MKPFLPVCLSALILGVACTALAQDRPVVHPFYPLKVGHQWTYRSGKEAVVIRVDKEVPIDFTREDKTEQRVIGFDLKIANGPRAVTEQVAVLPDGVYRFQTAGKTTRPPLRFFKFPLEKGDAWPVACKTDDGKVIRGTFVGGTDTIELMLNGKKEKLLTVTITSKDLQVDDQEMFLKYWFARDYGVVKQQVRTDKHETTMELEEFKAAK